MKRLVVYIMGIFFISGNIFAQKPELEVRPDIPDEGLVKLSWEPTESGWDYFTLYKKAPDSTSFTVIDTIYSPIQEYVDTITFCKKGGIYKVKEHIDNLESESNETPIFSKDPTPDILVLDSISIIQNNDLILGWHKSYDYTLKGYKILKFDDQFYVIKTINDPNQDTTIIDDLYPCDSNYNMVAIAFDGCSEQEGGSTNLNENYVQSTTKINQWDYDVCEQKVSFQLNGYQTADAFSQQATKYELWQIIDGNSYTKISESDNADEFSVSVMPSTEYSFFIRTFLSSDSLAEGTSSSCKINLKTNVIPQPDTVQITAASANEPVVNLTGVLDMDSKAQGFILRRSDDGAAFPAILDTLADVQKSWNYIDSTAKPDKQSYYYQLTAIDSCGRESKASQIHRTLHLNVESQDNNTNRLTWNAYEGWPVNRYYIYRYTQNPELKDPVKVVAGEIQSYTDDTHPQLQSGQWKYRILAVKTDSAAAAWSNDATASQETRLIMPNAFKPSGMNYEFKPRSANLSPEGYSFRIFNRWGAMVFESTNPETGWEGRYKGENAPAGTYIYILQYKNQKDNLIQKKGTVTLIR